jgi:hypothetical protein
MRPFVIALAACLACAHAPAQVAQSAPACPSPDALEAARNSAPPKQVLPSAPPPESGKVRITLREGPSRERYATYVIDSQYVGLVDHWAMDTVNYPLRGLPVTDIASITVFRDERAIEQWRSCPGVPVILITTTSKSWRPRTPAISKPGE